MMSRLLGVCVVLLSALALAVNDSWGQVRPGTTQPGQVERQLQRPPEPTAQTGAITIPGLEQPRPANADTIRFLLNDLTIDGVTVYRPEVLRKLYTNALYHEVTLADVYGIVDALTARYRNDGYILSQVIVPAQSVENGTVRLQAIEGYIADVRVEGGDDALRARARKYGEKVRSRHPLTAGALERQVLLLNDLPGVTARAVLAPSATPGASDLVLQLFQQKFGAALNADNRGSRAEGPQRLFTDVDARNLFGGASLTEVRDVTTLNKELFYISLAHDQFVGTGGGKFSVSGSYVYSVPEELSIIPLDLTTKSDSLMVTYSYPLHRRRSKNVYVRASLTGFDSTSTIFGVRDTVDHIRAVRLGLTADASDRLRGVNIADVEFSQGLQGLGATEDGDEYVSRPGGRTDFRRATLYAQRFQSLPSDFSLVLGANAQYAFTDLLAPELFSVGGEQFGRGYDPSEMLNDHGAAMKLDLRYTLRLRGASTLMPYAFFDAGKVWQRTPVAGINGSQSLSSAGFGFKVNLGRRLSGFGEFAKPLDKIVVQENNRDPRVYAGFSIQ